MKRPDGILYLVFPAMIGIAGFMVLLSGRDFSAVVNDAQSMVAQARSPLEAWAQRLVSLMVLLAAAERIITHFAHREPMPSPTLALAFIAFWFGTVAAPALYGSNPLVSHEYAYSLVLGIGLLMARATDGRKVIETLRGFLFLFMLVGVILIPLKPQLVLDTSYAQGLMSGVPRFAGLAPHPVTMGTLALTGLFCLWHSPFRRRWLNWAAWVTGLGVLFMAQSKTGWIAFLLGAVAMLLVRHAAAFWRRLGDSRNNSFGILVCAGFMVVVLTATVLLAMGVAGEKVSAVLDSAQGAQLVSMTGRDQIWGVAMEEWRQNWWFGYGPTLWDEAFRASIGMPYATHGHNQLMDTLARSGTVGAIALVVYSFVLLVLSFLYASATRGLSLALFVGLVMYSVSEAPMLMFGFGTEVTHLLLVLTLASAAAARRPVADRMPAGLRTAA